MSLDEYRAKREAATPEPGAERVERLGPLFFCVQLHRATREHFDLRLEVGGVLKSWAIPKGPHDDPDEKRFAAETEDHPFAYGAFEGVIPAGSYGAGEMLLWDVGTWFCDEYAPLSQSAEDWFDPVFRASHEAAILKAVADGKLSMYFSGERLKGSWTLVKTKDGWLFFKHRDSWAKLKGDLAILHRSVVSGRNWEEVARKVAPQAKWAFQKEPLGMLGDPAQLVPFGKREKLPRTLKPMKADMGERAFVHTDWVFEPKLDGVRVLALVENGQVALLSRNANDVASQFPEIVAQLALVKGSVVLDGEIVAFEDGKPGFTAMMKRFHLKDRASLEAADRQWPCVLFAFDVLHIDGVETRSQPLLERKRWLRQLALPPKRIQVVEHMEADGATFYQACVAAGFEGVIAKKADSRYDPTGRKSSVWLKLKHTSTGDFVVGGLFHGEGNRKESFGSLYVGAHDEDGNLVCMGRVGSGFNEEDLVRLTEELAPLKTKTCPFVGEVPIEGPHEWLRPERVVEVKYAEVMPSGHLRAPVYVRMRPDLDPADVLVPTEARVEVRSEAPAEEAPDVPSESLDDAFTAGVLLQLERPEKNMTLRVGGVEVNVTNLDKKLWPTGTKRDLLRYLARISGAMIPHLQDRPMTMIRYPEGMAGEKFFQKHIEHKPDWVETITFWGDTNGRNQEYLMVNDLPTLLLLGQLGTLEFHVPAGRTVYGPDGDELPLTFKDSDENLNASLFNYPDFIRFDLDPYVYSGQEKPGEEPELNREAFEKCKTVAFWLREMLESVGLSCWAKTTGKTGLHLFVPIVRDIDTQAARTICAHFCTTLERQHPREITTEWSVSKRTGKIFLDYNMNATGKTLGAAYSPRATASKAVSMPLTWEELASAYPEDFTLETAPAIVAKRGDAWAGILGAKVDLASLLG